MKKALQEAWHQARERFIQYTNVVGVGYGPKIRAGREVARESIIVLVTRKLPPNHVEAGQLIPASFNGFPTDVREPRLNPTPRKQFNPNHPPDDPNDECMTDNEWIDWGKIHQINLKQRRTKGGKRRQRKGGKAEALADNTADAPTVDVVGNLFIIHDPTQSLVTTVGGSTTYDYVAAYNLFRATFGDDYDFVSFYIDVGSGLPDVGNASNTVYNNVSGIGLASINNRSTWGTSRLLRYIYHSWFSLRTLMHEPSHQWLFYVNYRNSASGSTQDLLHQDWIWGAGQRAFHWGRWPDNDNSCMDYDRADWTANGDGTFNRTRHYEDMSPDDVWFGVNSLDQYLMGLIPASDVSNVTIVQNPSPAQSDANSGPYTPSPSATSASITKVQYEEGARSPDHLNGQRVFHQAVVIITRSAGTSSTFITSSETWRTGFTDRYRSATSGRLMVDTSLLRSNYSDLYVKDNAADTGGTSSSGTFWVSPDLWVRNADDDATSHQCPIRGQPNWIYVRVRNKGSQAYNNVTVNVYLANFLSLTPGTEFFYPVDWNPDSLIGSAAVTTVPAASGGIDGSAIAKIPWPASLIPPAAGWHPCLLTEIIPMETTPTGLHHVWENKKLAQRNLTIIDPGGGCPPMGDAHDVKAYAFRTKFMIGNALRAAQTSELRLQIENGSEAVQLFLDPAGLVKGIEEEGAVVELPAPIIAGREPRESETVQLMALLPASELATLKQGSVRGIFSGNVLFLSAGTECAMLADCDEDFCDSTTWFRFCSDTRIMVGHRKRTALDALYRLKGLRPVVMNGKPLLHVTDAQEARLTVRLRVGETATLQLIGLVSPYRGGQTTTCHVIESVAGSVVGGLAVEIGH